MTAFESFINTELPRRSSLLTKVITGYDADPNLVGAPAILKNAPLGSWFYEETAQKWWRKRSVAPADWSDQTAGGGAAAIDQREETYTPTAGQTVFNLSATPLNANDTAMFVNSLKYTHGLHYNVVGSVLTWTNVAFQLDSADYVEIVYFA
jgi:hypothetical protein